MELKGKKILVVGAGKTGIAVSKFLAGKKARVVVSESRPLEELEAELKCLNKLGVKVESGGHVPETFLGAELIVVSPGIPRSLESLVEAEKKGIDVISEIELAFRFIDVPIIAVTGSNGKTTTTSLLGKILKEAGKKVFVGGNIGNPLIAYPYRLLFSHIDEDLDISDNLYQEKNVKSEEEREDRIEYVIAEISSFQLEGIKSFRPHIGVLLNVSEDHLDRYESYLDYVNTKFEIFKYQGKSDFVVFNADDQTISTYISKIKATALPFSSREKFKNGVYLRGENIVFSWRGCEEICPVKCLKLRGRHNIENVMAAIGTARLLGIGMDCIIKAVESFNGLAHRMEWVRNYQGVSYYNDSKATNVGAVVRSLESFDKPVLLIAGGKDKGGDYSSLREPVKNRVKTLILIGEASERITESLGDCTETIMVKSLEDAVYEAQERAESGDIVLLSPACSSYDMFRDYEERGDNFKSSVKALSSPEDVGSTYG